MKEFTHISEKNQAKMVNVGHKKISQRKATAKGLMFLGEQIVSLLKNNEISSKKGPVFQTAIIAGIQGVKKTSELIPMCHPLTIDGIDLEIKPKDHEHIEITCSVEIEGKTGVEMEALTGVSVASLTIYDMCKSMSHEMVIKEIRLVEKTGGKSDLKV